MKMETHSLKRYIENRNKRLLKAAEGEGSLEGGKTKREILKIDQVQSQETWNWIKTGSFKKETEGMLMTAQDQALKTNIIKSKVHKQSVSPRCRFCREIKETIHHVVA